MPTVRFRIIIVYGSKYYHPADISINVLGGDVYYFPSKEILVGMGNLVPSGRSANHLSIHKDGKRHAKDNHGKKFQGSKILKIQEIGYQNLIVDDINNFDGVGLPHAEELRGTDCVLEMPSSVPPAGILQISIISGRMIADRSARRHSTGEDGLIAINHRAIGYESGNADKLIQFALYFQTASPEGTGRRSVTLPENAQIRRPGS